MPINRRQVLEPWRMTMSVRTSRLLGTLAVHLSPLKLVALTLSALPVSIFGALDQLLEMCFFAFRHAASRVTGGNCPLDSF